LRRFYNADGSFFHFETPELAMEARQEAAKEMKRLREDREWQIKQNVRMFTALEQMAKHLKLPCDKRDDGILEQIVEDAMVAES
jgi:ribosome recycling factor